MARWIRYVNTICIANGLSSTTSYPKSYGCFTSVQICKEDQAHFFAKWLDSWIKSVDSILSSKFKLVDLIPEDLEHADQLDVVKRLREIQQYLDTLDPGLLIHLLLIRCV